MTTPNSKIWFFRFFRHPGTFLRASHPRRGPPKNHIFERWQDVKKSKKSYFWVRGRHRVKKSPWFRKNYLEVRTRSGKGRKIDFSNLDFSIFANFRWFPGFWGIFEHAWPSTPDNGGAKMSKNLIFAKSDLKHPQTTLESHLDGFGEDWDRSG